MDRAAGPGVGSDEPVTDPQQRARQNVLVGGIVKFSTMYSGGGADASTLQLARVRHLQDDIQVDDDVLTVPWLGNAMIRACFSEQDIKQRAGACHDEYGFSAKLALDTVAEGMPVLRYQTVATRYPAGVSRFEDSLAKGPLKKKDLRSEQDPACTYTRLFRFGRDVPSRPGAAGLCRLYRTLKCRVEPRSTGLRMGRAKSQSSMARLYKSGGGAYSQRVDVMMLSLSTNTRRRSWRMSLVVMVLGPIGLTRPAPLSRDRRRMLGSLAGWPIAQPSWLASQRPLPLTSGPGC